MRQLLFFHLYGPTMHVLQPPSPFLPNNVACSQSTSFRCKNLHREATQRISMSGRSANWTVSINFVSIQSHLGYRLWSIAGTMDSTMLLALWTHSGPCLKGRMINYATFLPFDRVFPLTLYLQLTSTVQLLFVFFLFGCIEVDQWFLITPMDTG